MKHKTFDSIYFWQNIMEKSDYTWQHLFDEQITEKSIFGHFVLVNCYGDGFLNNWITFPGAQAFIGFLKHVYLPTAYVEWFARKDSEGFIPIETDPESWIEHLKQSQKQQYKKEISLMEAELQKLELVWDLEEKARIQQLKAFAESFTKQWTKRQDVFFHFQIFDSPEEIDQYMVKIYEKNQLIERISDHLGVSKEEWWIIAAHVYENEFMRKRFHDLLTNYVAATV